MGLIAGMDIVADPATGERRRRLPEVEITEPPLLPRAPVSRFERSSIDYAALDAAKALCDQAIRSTRQRLDAQAGQASGPG